MSLDRELLEEYLEAVASKYTASELVELLEDNGIITVWDIINLLEEFVIEGKEHLAIDY